MWNDSEERPLGMSRAAVLNPQNQKKYSIEFEIVNEGFTPLLGFPTAEQMGLITVNKENVEHVFSVDVVDKYAVVFDGKIGTLPGTHHLKLDEDATPVIMPSRRLPIAVRPRLKEALDDLVKRQVIAPVDEPHHG